MKNRWMWRKIMAIVMVFAMCPTPVHSAEPCDHNYVETVDTAPTCKGAYGSTFTCSICGDSYRKTYEPLEHSFKDDIVLDAGDCSHDATIRTVCTVCGAYGTKFAAGDPSIHYYDLEVVVKRQTCTDAGLNQKTCFYCGHVKDIIVPALGGTHAMYCDPSQTVTATCANEGKTVWVCSNVPCGYKEVITYPKLINHSWNDVGVAVEPTCSSAGVMNIECYFCGTESTRELMQLSHSWKMLETVPAQCNKDGYILLGCWDCAAETTEIIHMGTVPHNYVKADAESKAATCKDDGILVMRCTGCNDTYSTAVSKLTVPHSYEFTEEMKATCVADGYKKETCSVCGDLGITSYPSDPSCHSYKVIARTPATCIADGVVEYECEHCGDYKSEVLPMSEEGHNWVDTANCKSATCTDDGIDEKECTICHGLDTKVIPALGHIMNAGEVLIAPDCINDGQTKYTCTACGYEEYDHPVAFGHDYAYDYSVEATCTEFYYEVFSCTRCGASDIRNKGTEYGEHDYIEAGVTAPTCGVDGVREFTCSLCSAVRQDSIPATNLHDLKLKSETTPQGCMPGERVYECSVCGATEVEGIVGNGEHSWKLVNEQAPGCGSEGFKEYKCEFCSKSKAETQAATGVHEWSVVSETAATCDSDGYKTYECLGCGEGKSETIPAFGHEWFETSYIAAICVADGSSEYECLICGDTKTEVIPATGEHLWCAAGKTNATCTKDGFLEFECSDCDATKSEALKKTGHSYGEWKTEKKATTTKEGCKARACKLCGDKQTKSIAKLEPEKHDSLYKGITAWDEVYKLQLDLIELDYLHEEPDGVFGARTEKAVADFQKDAGLEVTGIADAETLKQIAEALNKGEVTVTVEAIVTVEPETAVPEVVAEESTVVEMSAQAESVAYAHCEHVVNAEGVSATHYCAEHQMLLATFDMLLSAATTDEARAKALTQSAAMWGVELDFLYQAWIDAVPEAERPMIVNSIAMFSANLEAQEYTWNQMYGEGSVEAVSRVNEMVINQCVDLCALVYGLNTAN